MTDLLNEWVKAGYLRPLDRAFANFLQGQAEKMDPLVRIIAALVSYQTGRGHVCLDLNRLLQGSADTLFMQPDSEQTQNDDASVTSLSSAFGSDSCEQLTKKLSRAELIVGTGEGVTPLVLSGTKVYLRRHWLYEQQIRNSLDVRVSKSVAVDEVTLKEILNELFTSNGAASQPDWQKIACALAVRAQFFILTGGPGTGKTTTVVKLLQLLQRLQLQHPTKKTLAIGMAAPTGKAAARLSESIKNQVTGHAIPSEVNTLHRLLGSMPESRHFRHNKNNLLPLDVVVIDEASMIDVEMMNNLLQALAPDARLILLGDKDQLASVEAGAVLGNLCANAGNGRYTQATAHWIQRVTGENIDSRYICAEGTAQDQAITMLRHSYRFGQRIGELACAVNAQQVTECRAILNSGTQDVVHCRLKDIKDLRMEKVLVEGYRTLLETIQNGSQGQTHDEWATGILKLQAEFQVLCAVRCGDWGVEGINKEAEQVLRASGLLGKNGDWYVGRPVIVTRNDYALGLMNGDRGITLPDKNGKLRVVFSRSTSDGGVYWVSPARLSDVETAFAMTVHKSQGSEFARVALIMPDKINPVLTKELLYTGITRAKEQFILIDSNDDVLKVCIEANVERD